LALTTVRFASSPSTVRIDCCDNTVTVIALCLCIALVMSQLSALLFRM